MIKKFIMAVSLVLSSPSSAEVYNPRTLVAVCESGYNNPILRVYYDDSYLPFTEKLTYELKFKNMTKCHVHAEGYNSAFYWAAHSDINVDFNLDTGIVNLLGEIVL